MDVKPRRLLGFVADKPHRLTRPLLRLDQVHPSCTPRAMVLCRIRPWTESSRPPGGGKFSSRTLAGTALLGDLRLLILRAEVVGHPPRGLLGAWRPPEPTRGVCMGWPPAWRGGALRRFGGIPPASLKPPTVRRPSADPAPPVIPYRSGLTFSPSWCMVATGLGTFPARRFGESKLQGYQKGESYVWDW